VWSQILTQVGVSWHSRTWTNWVMLISSIKGKSLKSLLIKLAFISTVYHIWIERNIRKFQNVSCTVFVVIHKIHSIIKHRLLSLGTLPQGPQSQWLLTKWDLV
jgi:hypothetical protein